MTLTDPPIFRSRIRKVGGLNPLARWRWEVEGAGLWGYAASKRAAASEATLHMERLLNMIAGRGQ